MPCLDKRVLGQIKGFVPVAAHSETQVIDRLFIGDHQLLKSGFLALTGAANQFQFVQILTSNPA